MPGQEPFTHANQAEGTGIGDLGLGNTDPVICDFEFYVKFRHVQAHLDRGRLRMAGDICQCLLADAKQGCRQVLVQVLIQEFGFPAAVDK